MLAYLLGLSATIATNEIQKDSAILVKNYYPSGIMMEQGYMLEETKQGSWRYYYESGKIKSGGDYKNGKQNGWWKEIFD